jgi:hypothetical protein
MLTSFFEHKSEVQVYLDVCRIRHLIHIIRVGEDSFGKLYPLKYILSAGCVHMMLNESKVLSVPPNSGGVRSIKWMIDLWRSGGSEALCFLCTCLYCL